MKKKQLRREIAHLNTRFDALLALVEHNDKTQYDRVTNLVKSLETTDQVLDEVVHTLRTRNRA